MKPCQRCGDELGLNGSEGLCCHCRAGFPTRAARDAFAAAVLLREWAREREQLRSLPRGPGERWLQMAKVRANHFVIVLNAGYPYGFIVDWAGNLQPYQTMEFLRWTDIEAVAAWRLRWSGLEGLEFVRSDECLLDAHTRLVVRVKRVRHKPWLRTRSWPVADWRLTRHIGMSRRRPLAGEKRDFPTSER